MVCNLFFTKIKIERKMDQYVSVFRVWAHRLVQDGLRRAISSFSMPLFNRIPVLKHISSYIT